jgi:DNA-binding NtrC family response regulator
MFWWLLRRTLGVNCPLPQKSQARIITDQTSPAATLNSGGSEPVRILIVCEDDAVTKQLKHFLREEGYLLEGVKSMTAACVSAKSGQFQVVFTTPVLGDGSWKRLVDLASLDDLGFVVVLVSGTFDIKQWGEALEDGAFDVLDVLHDLPKTAEAASRALWAAYLKRVGRAHPENALPPWAA